jgi:hypothetical protein
METKERKEKFLTKNITKFYKNYEPIIHNQTRIKKYTRYNNNINNNNHIIIKLLNISDKILRATEKKDAFQRNRGKTDSRLLDRNYKGQKRMEQHVQVAGRKKKTQLASVLKS